MTQAISPPFTQASALAKVQAAENAWNTRNPEVVVRGYSEDSNWRNRAQYLSGRAAIVEFLAEKWTRELHYRLKKELWAFCDERIAVRFIYEWQHSATGQWYRTHGNEHWEFEPDGLMSRRDMSANDIPISAAVRQLCGPGESLPATEKSFFHNQILI